MQLQKHYTRYAQKVMIYPAWWPALACCSIGCVSNTTLWAFAAVEPIVVYIQTYVQEIVEVWQQGTDAFCRTWRHALQIMMAHDAGLGAVMGEL